MRMRHLVTFRREELPETDATKAHGRAPSPEGHDDQSPIAATTSRTAPTPGAHERTDKRGEWSGCRPRVHRDNTTQPEGLSTDRPWLAGRKPPTANTDPDGSKDTVRAFRVFNGLGRTVDIEWTVFGQRYRFWSMTAVVAILAGSAALIPLVSLFAALPAAGLGLLVVLMATARLNRMDPEGYLRELTQLRALYQSATRSSISNIRHHSTAGRARITNTGRR